MRNSGALVDFSFPDSMSPAAFQKQHNSSNGHYNAKRNTHAPGIAHRHGDDVFSMGSDAAIGNVQQQLIFNRNYLSDRIRSSNNSKWVDQSKQIVKPDPDAPIDGSDRLALSNSYIADQSNDMQQKGSSLFPYRGFSVNLNSYVMDDYSHNDHSHNLLEFSLDDERDPLMRNSTMESTASSSRSTLIDIIGIDGADSLPDTTMSGLAAITAAAEALPLSAFDPSDVIDYAHSPSRARSNQSMLIPSKQSIAMKMHHDSQLYDEDHRPDSALDADIAYSYAANMEKFLSNGSKHSLAASFNPSSSPKASCGSPGMV